MHTLAITYDPPPRHAFPARFLCFCSVFLNGFIRMIGTIVIIGIVSP